MDVTDVVKITGDRILVRPIKKAETSEGGIVLPDTLLGNVETTGVVVAVGSGPVTSKGVRLDHFVRVGDTVLFSPTAGFETDAFDEIHFIMREEDVLAVIDTDTEESK